MTYRNPLAAWGLSWLAARRISYSRATPTRQLMTKKTHGIDLSQGGYTEAQFSGGYCSGGVSSLLRRSLSSARALS